MNVEQAFQLMKNDIDSLQRQIDLLQKQIGLVKKLAASQHQAHVHDVDLGFDVDMDDQNIITTSQPIEK